MMARRSSPQNGALWNGVARVWKQVVGRGALPDFDAAFYLRHYEDLRQLKTRKQALRHYATHGRAEGRFPNEAAYRAHIRNLTDQFDLAAYKFFNRDLVGRLDGDDAFLRHYVQHGHAEGRRSRFDDGAGAEPIPADQKWRTIFNAGDMLAWAGAALDPRPQTRAEALAVFEAEGIDQLWPINLEYAFDPQFVRDHGLMPGRFESDADLYRAWLAEGFPAGIAPNERIFLSPLLGGAPVPADVDWPMVASALGISAKTRPSQIVASLFSAPLGRVMTIADHLVERAPWMIERIARRALGDADQKRALELLSLCAGRAPTAERFVLLGDVWVRLGQPGNALRAYRDAMTLDHAPWRAYTGAIDILAAQADYAQIYEILANARPAWRHRPDFGVAVRAVLQSHFDHVSAICHAAYREADAQKRIWADRTLADTLDTIADQLRLLDELPAHTGGQPLGYVAILANDDLRQCTYYRVEQKQQLFAAAGIPVRVYSHHDVAGFMDSLIGARAALFYRVASTPEILRTIIHSRAMGLPTWYEIDDLLFDSAVYPDPLASFEGQISPAEYAGLQFGVPLFRYAMAQCEHALASTPALAKRMQPIVAGGRSLVLRNGLDERNDPMIRIGEAPTRGGARVRIFYGSGTKAHNADFNDLVAPALAQLMSAHPAVDVVIVGHLKLGDVLDRFADRIMTFPVISDVATYWGVLACCDINLAVLQPGAVADCKSEIKWLEAAVLQIPSIVSATQTYREVVDDGVDGLIAEGAQQWCTHLHHLVENPEARMRIGQAARQKALREYAMAAGANALVSAFSPEDTAIVPPSLAQVRRIRVLICNVFYAPQSYGGATRVVEQNVAALRARYPDLAIAVLCVDDGAVPAGQLRQTEENGVAVYRLAVPPDARIDWTPFNAAHAEPFERVLDDFRPDVIHFHCIQRLTATIVEVALARAIPYLVTLHDAWWISDDQFLLDRDGLLHLPGTDVLSDSATAQDPAAAAARRQRLGALLRGSAANVSVSDPFASVYAMAGIGKLHVAENDVMAIPPLRRSNRKDRRVAVGHVGGRSAHKGAALVEAVLRQGRYADLHLTMVDGRLQPGESIETVWGNTPVTLIAPVPQADVASLYAALDVLLAPSTWPEGYGLVTREALSAGLWVVASDRGAIGSDIEPGVNGDVIDVTTSQGLAETLAKIDADPERYRAERTPWSPRRPDGPDQVATLASLYREITRRLQSSDL